MMSKTSLVTEVILHRPHQRVPTYLWDVPVRAEQRGKYLDLEFTTLDEAVTIRLNGAEVIALIELLGGKLP